MAVYRRHVLLALACPTITVSSAASSFPVRLLYADEPGVGGDRVTTELGLSEQLDNLDEAVAGLIASYERAAIGTSAVRARHGLAVGLSLLRDGRLQTGNRQRLRLHRCVGRFAALLAATRADLDDASGAVEAFAVAFDHASIAGDRSTQGWIRVWQATLARGSGDPRTGSALAREAARLAGRRSPVAARAAVVEGHCEGMLGDRWAVHDRVGHAWRIVGDLAAAERGEPGFSVDEMHPATLAEMSASVYTDLGWADLAYGYVDVSIAELDATGATGLRSLLRVAAGASAACQGDVERAVAWVNEALDLSAVRPSALLTARSARFLSEARRTVGTQPLFDDLEERLRSWSTPLA